MIAVEALDHTLQAVEVRPEVSARDVVRRRAGGGFALEACREHALLLPHRREHGQGLFPHGRETAIALGFTRVHARLGGAPRRADAPHELHRRASCLPETILQPEQLLLLHAVLRDHRVPKLGKPLDRALRLRRRFRLRRVRRRFGRGHGLVTHALPRRVRGRRALGRLAPHVVLCHDQLAQLDARTLGPFVLCHDALTQLGALTLGPFELRRNALAQLGALALGTPRRDREVVPHGAERRFAAIQPRRAILFAALARRERAAKLLELAREPRHRGHDLGAHRCRLVARGRDVPLLHVEGGAQGRTRIACRARVFGGRLHPRREARLGLAPLVEGARHGGQLFAQTARRRRDLGACPLGTFREVGEMPPVLGATGLLFRDVALHGGELARHALGRGERVVLEDGFHGGGRGAQLGDLRAHQAEPPLALRIDAALAPGSGRRVERGFQRGVLALQLLERPDDAREIHRRQRRDRRPRARGGFFRHHKRAGGVGPKLLEAPFLRGLHAGDERAQLGERRGVDRRHVALPRLDDGRTCREPPTCAASSPSRPTISSRRASWRAIVPRKASRSAARSASAAVTSALGSAAYGAGGAPPSVAATALVVSGNGGAPTAWLP